MVRSRWPRSTSTTTRASPSRSPSSRSRPSSPSATARSWTSSSGRSPRRRCTAFVERLAPAPSEADNLVAAGDEASLRSALELEPDHAGAIEALARLLIDRGDAPEALALLQRIPETEATRALAAEARLLEAGVDVSATDGDEIEAKLNELLERVRDDDAARQEFVDLLEAMGADDPRTNEYRRALAARLF